MVDYGHWDITEQMPPGAFGFVYLIENRINGRKYIGKKNLFSDTSKKVPGRVRRVHTIKDSNWRKYTGSGTLMKKAIEEHGKENFSFLILEWHLSAGALRYREAELQWKNDVLTNRKLPCGERLWYNNSIADVYSKPKEFESDCISDEVRVKLSQGMLGKKNSLKDDIIGVSIEDGSTIGPFNGRQALIDAGFDYSAVYKVIRDMPVKNGKGSVRHRKHHKGYKWYWKENYESGTTN